MLPKAVILYRHNRLKIDVRQFRQRRVTGVCLHPGNFVLQALLLECVTIHEVSQNSHYTAAHDSHRQDQQNDSYQQFFSIFMTHLTVYSI